MSGNQGRDFGSRASSCTRSAETTNRDDRDKGSERKVSKDLVPNNAGKNSSTDDQIAPIAQSDEVSKALILLTQMVASLDGKFSQMLSSVELRLGQAEVTAQEVKARLDSINTNTISLTQSCQNVGTAVNQGTQHLSEIMRSSALKADTIDTRIANLDHINPTLNDLTTSVTSVIMKVSDLDNKIGHVGTKVESIIAGLMPDVPERSTQSYQTQSPSSHTNHNNSNSRMGSSWILTGLKDRFIGTTPVYFYIWRLPSAESSCPTFAEYLKEAAKNRGIKAHVQEISCIAEIRESGRVIICGFGSASRFDSEPMLERMRMIQDHSAPSIVCRVELVVFRYGEGALPAPVTDSRRNLVPSHCLNFSQQGLHLNEITKKGIDDLLRG